MLPQAMDTLVLLMGGGSLTRITSELQRQGRAGGTPVEVVHKAALPGQRVWRGTLADIAARCEGEALSPCIIIVGGVVGGEV